jgi:DNA-binding NtrC family response regulator
VPSLLIIEDEPKLRRLLVKTLDQNPEWNVRTYETGEEALVSIEETPPDVILTDLRLPGIGGIDLLKSLKERNLATRFVVMTAYASVGSAVEALRAGALDYLIKPFPGEELLHVLGRIEREIFLEKENRALRTRLSSYESPKGLIGKSEPMAHLRKLIAKVAPTQSTVLIRGESGTGKELVARALHEQSGRHQEPLVRVNCGAIPENLLESELFGHTRGAFTGATEKRTGRFETAGEGTIFLDEIGELPPNLQVKLLRVLQDREYEPVGSSQTRTTTARVIAATNRDLEAAMTEGKFREDLFYRLNVVTLEVPPLAEHLEDLAELVLHFIDRIASREAIAAKRPSPQFLEILGGWGWPGNVRELENAIEAALVLGEGETLEVEDLPPYLRKQAISAPLDPRPSSTPGSLDTTHATLDEAERYLIEQALRETQGNQSEAARRLGVTRRTLNYRRQKYGI